MPEPLPFLVRLYPRGWRERYGAEMAAMLEDVPLTPRLTLDIIAGAIDARVHTQPIIAAHAAAGDRMSALFRTCASDQASVADHVRSAAWIVGGTVLLTLASAALKSLFGGNLVAETLRYAAFPLALLWAGRWTTMKPYSASVQAVILGVTGAIVFGICFAAALLAYRL